MFINLANKVAYSYHLLDAKKRSTVAINKMFATWVFAFSLLRSSIKFWTKASCELVPWFGQVFWSFCVHLFPKCLRPFMVRRVWSRCWCFSDWRCDGQNPQKPSDLGLEINLHCPDSQVLVRWAGKPLINSQDISVVDPWHTSKKHSHSDFRRQRIQRYGTKIATKIATNNNSSSNHHSLGRTRKCKVGAWYEYVDQTKCIFNSKPFKTYMTIIWQTTPLLRWYSKPTFSERLHLVDFSTANLLDTSK